MLLGGEIGPDANGCDRSTATLFPFPAPWAQLHDPSASLSEAGELEVPRSEAVEGAEVAVTPGDGLAGSGAGSEDEETVPERTSFAARPVDVDAVDLESVCGESGLGSSDAGDSDEAPCSLAPVLESVEADDSALGASQDHHRIGDHIRAAPPLLPAVAEWNGSADGGGAGRARSDSSSWSAGNGEIDAAARAYKVCA